MKHITLCADDYGQNDDISQGILALLQQGRLSAVSCMTSYAHWPHHAAALSQLKNNNLLRDNIDLGLHFDLTHFLLRKGWSFNQLIMESCLGRINVGEIESELVQQLDAFEQALGTIPDFVDGHQHVHAFPGIRQAFLSVLARRYAKKLPYIRWSAPAIGGHDSALKAIILRLLVTGFASRAKNHGFKFPKQFLGMYSLRPTNYASLFSGWLNQAKDGALFMCHPGKPSQDPEDPIKKARLVEYNYFGSNEFLTDLTTKSVCLSRWRPE